MAVWTLSVDWERSLVEIVLNACAAAETARSRAGAYPGMGAERGGPGQVRVLSAASAVKNSDRVTRVITGLD
jgi:hypothetical protein